MAKSILALLSAAQCPFDKSVSARQTALQSPHPTSRIRDRKRCRIDHNFSSTQRLTGRYTRDLSQTRELGGLFFGLTIPDVGTTDTTVPGDVLAISLTSSFGARIVNEFSFTFSGNKITDDLVGRYNSDFNVPNSELFPQNNSDLPPVIDITGSPTVGSRN